MGMQLNMDYSNVEPNSGGGQWLPISDSKGWLVVISDSKGQENSAKTGTVLVLDIVGQEGAAQGKTTQHFINITNPVQKAAEIGQGECSAIAHATGHVRVGNSSEWHGKPFRVVVTPDPSEKYPNATRITAIRDVHGNVPKLPGQGAMQQGGQQAGNFGQQGNFGGNAAQGQQATGAGQQVSGNAGGQFQPSGQQGQGQFQQGQFQPNNQQGGGQQFQQNNGQQGQFQQNNGGFDPNTGQPINNGGQQQQGQFQQNGQQGGQPGWSQ